MPPKKTRVQHSSSQPLPDAQKPTRSSGRKRRHSDASHTSDPRPSSSQSNESGAQVKRRRKGKAAAAAQPEPQVIIEEDEEEVEVNAEDVQHSDVVCEAPSEHAIEDSIEVSQSGSKHVHFGSGARDDEEEPSTATNITPYPRKMTVKRRFTLSPSVGMTKRLNSPTTRTSLPPNLSEPEGTTNVIQELQFAPLRAVLGERVRRRLRRSHLSEEQNEIEAYEKRDSRTQRELDQLRIETAEKETRIHELALEIEVQRQFGIDVSDESAAEQQRIREIEKELGKLRREIAGHGDKVEMPDSDMLVLESQEEIAYPQLPTPRSSQATNDEPSKVKVKVDSQDSNSTRLSLGVSALSETERRKFEDAILVLSREAQDAKAHLKVLSIELQALGFGDDGVDNTMILTSIRESFDHVRESLETILPDSLPEDAPTQDLIEILVANVKEFADRLRTQDQEIHEKTSLITDLGNQIDGLLDHLAEAEIRKAGDGEKLRKLQESNEKRKETIEGLEEELDAAHDDQDALQQTVDEKTTEAKILGEDNIVLNQDLEKLRMTLEDYRHEESKLTELISRMEEEHRETVRKMALERETTVQDLENRLDAETQQRCEADQLSLTRQDTIVELELRVQESATLRDELREELDDIKADREAEIEARESAEASLEQKAVHIEDLSLRVSRLESELSALEQQIQELRQLNENERLQREAAETDLDDRNAEIGELSARLLEQGKEANELRQKLFEVQNRNAESVRELEQVASDRESRFQEDMAEEVRRRETADDLAQQRATNILALERKIEEIELGMRDALAERDERVAALEDDIAQRDAEIENLRNDLRSAEGTLNTERSQNEAQKDELEASVAALQETIDEYQATITDLQQEAITTTNLHNSEIEDRNAEIAELHANIAGLENEKSDLENQKAGLERRVEQEAVQMLEMQNDQANKIDALETTIREKQAKIRVVEEKAVIADERWQEVMEAREEEILNLKSTSTNNMETINSLNTSNAELKRRLRDYIRRSSGVIDNLQGAIITAKNVAEDEGEALKSEADALVDELDAMDTHGEQRQVMQTTKKTTTSSGSTKKGRGRNSKVRDSGVVMDGEIADDEMIAV